MIIAISNQKGGVGKTTTAINLGGAFAKAGKRVLFIDIDPQANLTAGLTKSQPAITIYHLLTGKKSTKNIIIERSKNMYILPAGIALASAVLELSSQAGREYILKEAMRKVIRDMDYIIIDTPPDLSLLTQNAWAICDNVIIPVQTEYYALHGVKQLIQGINIIKRRINPNINILGLLPTMFDKRRKAHVEVLAMIKNASIKTFNGVIRLNTKLSEAPAHSKTIQEYAPTCMGA